MGLLLNGINGMIYKNSTQNDTSFFSGNVICKNKFTVREGFAITRLKRNLFIKNIYHSTLNIANTSIANFTLRLPITTISDLEAIDSNEYIGPNKNYWHGVKIADENNTVQKDCFYLVSSVTSLHSGVPGGLFYLPGSRSKWNYSMNNPEYDRLESKSAAIRTSMVNKCSLPESSIIVFPMKEGSEGNWTTTTWNSDFSYLAIELTDCQSILPAGWWPNKTKIFRIPIQLPISFINQLLEDVS